MSSEASLLDAVLAPGGISITLQPIFEMSEGRQRVTAVECLSRGPRGTNLEPANVLFEYVRRKKEETAVDRACVMAGLMATRSLPSSIRINLNVHASTLGRDRAFVGFLQSAADACGIDPSRLVVEIVEHSPYWDGPGFMKTLDALRAIGIAIALDDVGLGYSNYKMMIDTHPQYLKLDRYLIQGCDADPYRRIVLGSIRRLASELGAEVVAEGVETTAELETLLGIGIQRVQGYLLSANRTHDELVDSGLLQARSHPWRPL
ncbi:MAG TPA: EAL domain-containing protein, partial [Thermoanaerobaculia bacterium]|nr:EAL domain-containing protein [Thermoanaerobaculia bacterium]